jgi:hypothetical protein
VREVDEGFVPGECLWRQKKNHETTPADLLTASLPSWQKEVSRGPKQLSTDFVRKCTLSDTDSHVFRGSLEARMTQETDSGEKTRPRLEQPRFGSRPPVEDSCASGTYGT